MAIGLDVHPYYQRALDWSQASGIGYTWVKVTDGGRRYTKTVGGVTYYPKTMVDRARSRGIFVGGYCYGQPGDGAAHGDLLIDENENLGAIDLVPAMDIESDPNIHTWGTQEAIDYGRSFCSRAIRRGYRPGIYMGNAMALATRPDTWPENPVLWLARYGSRPSVRHDVHQYTSSGVVGGVTVDMNESYNDSHLRPRLSVQEPKPKVFTEGQMITLPVSAPDTTGLPGMPPVPFMTAPGVGHFKLVFMAGPAPVYFVDPVQIVWNSPNSHEMPLELPHHIEANQAYWLDLNQDSLGVRFPYSTEAEFKAAIYQVG